MSYRIVVQDQKSDAWKTWRKEGIGASDAPIILGLSPYMKPYKLWQIKLGLCPDKTMSPFVEERASQIENAARATLELELGYNIPGVCAEDVDFPFLKASFDGFNEEHKTLMEAKWVAADKVQGKMPASHWVQMQHQMMVSGFDKVIYMRSNDGVKFYSDVVYRDDKYIKMMFSEEVKFWEMVLQNKAPSDERRKAGWREANDPV